MGANADLAQLTLKMLSLMSATAGASAELRTVKSASGLSWSIDFSDLKTCRDEYKYQLMALLRDDSLRGALLGGMSRHAHVCSK